MGKYDAARMRKEAQKKAATYQDTSWEELERTSLDASVYELLDVAAQDAAARHAQKLAEDDRRVEAAALRRASEQKREEARRLFLEDQKRKARIEASIAQARSEGRELGEAIATEIERFAGETRREQGAVLQLERAKSAGKLAYQTHRLQQLLVAAVACIGIATAGAGGAYVGMQENATSQLSSLRAQAVEQQQEAISRVAALQEQLSSRSFMAAAEEGQLREALRLAQADAESAQRDVIEFDKQKTAPRQLASTNQNSTVTVARNSTTATKPNLSTAIKEANKASPSTIAYDFGMAADECDAHDPLCGNL